MKEAMFYSREDDLKVRCALCSHNCLINDGKRGVCAVRVNTGGVLNSMVYGKLIAMNVDPIEKKPLFHFHPASTSLSIAAEGCNFRCMHCQNFDISQHPREHNDIQGSDAAPHDVVTAAANAGCRSISYTYTEPTVFYEFAYDCAVLAHEQGIKNVFVSNGYTSPEAVMKIAPFLDGINIDLKGDDAFYKEVCGARLQPVLDNLKLMRELGVWVEVTTLIIPSYNDSETTLNGIAEYIVSVDRSIPWHVTQFYPTYKLMDQPRTPFETLERAREIGYEKGLRFVYEGNVPGEGRENTYCPNCGELLIERSGYRIMKNHIQDDRCFNCMENIEGVWR